MRLIRTADGFLYIDEQGREIPLPDIDDEEGEAAFDEDDFEEEAETADGPEDGRLYVNRLSAVTSTVTPPPTNII